jgi:hypothetical protein
MSLSVGKERIFNKAFENRSDVIKWDVQKITDGQKIKIKIISTNSNKKQGIRIALDKGIEIQGNIYQSLQLWEDTIPEEVICTCHTEDGLLSVYNMWDKGKGPDSQSHTSGMLLEELNNVLIYRCNDIGFETNFDKIVFTIEKI